MKFLQHELAYRLATQRQLSRREALFKMGAGIGGIGLASMLGSHAVAAEQASPLAQRCQLGQCLLPGAYAGAYVNIHDMKPDAVITDLKNAGLSSAQQREQLDLLAKINQMQLARLEQDQNLEAGIQAMEMAFRMQVSVPEVFDVSRESEETRKLYGESELAKGCLIARRLIQEGVRVVQLSHSIGLRKFPGNFFQVTRKSACHHPSLPSDPRTPRSGTRQ